MAEARKDPAIIHWCGSRKPWKILPAWKAEEYKKYEQDLTNKNIYGIM